MMIARTVHAKHFLKLCPAPRCQETGKVSKKPQFESVGRQSHSFNTPVLSSSLMANIILLLAPVTACQKALESMFPGSRIPLGREKRSAAPYIVYVNVWHTASRLIYIGYTIRRSEFKVDYLWLMAQITNMLCGIIININLNN